MKTRQFFRNRVEVLGEERDSLWELDSQGMYVLVNEDELIIADSSYAPDFYPVENPFPETN